MPSSKFGSKFLGEERYQQYVDELTADGTIDGEKLSPEERKEGFKKRNDKIGFQEFVGNVLDKKQSATVSKKSIALPGGGGGALVRQPKSAVGITKLDSSKIAPSAAEGGGILEEILKIVTSIRDTLIEKNEFDVGQSKKDSQTAERTKRAKKEKGLESGIFKGLAKATEKVLAPVKGMFEKIFDFIKTVILGNIVMNILKWMGDKKNKEKIDNLIRFFKDFWPAIVGAYLLFGTKFGGLIRTIGGWALKIIRFAVPKLMRFVSRNPKAAAALAVAGGVGMLGARILTGTEVGADEEEGEQTPEQQQEAEFKAAQTTATESLKEAEEPAKMSKGGKVPGSGNKDTVPAMLTPGEFVMSKGAVSKYGTNTLASMNSMGGGTNIPSLMGGGVLGFSGGGSVSKDEEPGGRNKTKSDDEGGGFLGGIGKMFGLGKPSTIQSTPTKDNDNDKGSGGGSLKDLTGQDFRDLAFIVSAEAQRGTDDEYGVSAAVLNRVADPAWPNTIKAVGSQAGQFEAVFKGLAKDDPELAAKLSSPEGQAKIVEAMKKLKGRTDFKGTSQYGNMGKGDIKFSNRGNFYHYKEQVGKNDPPPAPLPSYYTKFIGTGGPAVTLAGTTASGGGGSIASSSGGGSTSSTSSSSSSGGSGPKFDYKKIRQELGIKSASVSKSSRPSSTAAYTQMQQGQQQTPQKTEKSQSPGIPSFDAAAMSSSKKIKTLGITV